MEKEVRLLLAEKAITDLKISDLEKQVLEYDGFEQNMIQAHIDALKLCVRVIDLRISYYNKIH